MEVVKDPDNGYAQAFTRLVEEHQRSLLHISYMYLKDRTLAEDAVQETFIKAYKAMGQFRGECTEKTWLCRILINTCRDFNKSAWFKNINRSLQPEDIKEPPAPPEDVQTIALSDAIWRLPRKHREIILLYFYQELTMSEVAQTLHISVATVSRRMKTACNALGIILREEGIVWTKSM